MAKNDGDSVRVRRIDEGPRVQMKAKRTLYADADGNPTDDASKAAQQITEKGVEILPHVLAQYDFEDGDLKVAKKAASKATESDDADVKGTAPTENKSASPAKATKSK